MSQKADFSETKILAVDDDPFIRKMFQSMLRNKGFQVYTAADGADAVSKALNIKPDIIFLDVMMPQVDGFQALEMLRKMDQTRTTPIIIATARADSATLLKAIKLGANDFIAKPFTRTMIMQKVRLALAPPESFEPGEAEERINPSRKRTFINTSVFREMKNGYIIKFDQIFVTMIRHLSQRSKSSLNRLLDETEEACKTYEIDEPLPILDDLKQMVQAENWEIVMQNLEKVYAIFRKMQTKTDKPDKGEKEENQSEDNEKSPE